MTNQIQTIESSEALIAQQKAELDMQISTAKAYPRELGVVLDQCQTMINLSPDVAASCNYSLTKGGKIISGPSVRLAEIVAANWGNLHVASRITGEDQEWVYTQAAAHDLEKNVKFVSEVKRRITDKNGKKYRPDVIQTTAAAATAIATRNAVFKTVPRVYVDQLSEIAKVAARGKKENLVQRVENALIHFRDKYDVSPEAICQKLEVSGPDKIKTKQLDTLLGIATALQDGQTTVENEFPSQMIEPQAATGPVQDDFLDGVELDK